MTVLWIFGGIALGLLVLVALVVMRWWRHRQRERIQRAMQLESVYNSRMRRGRGN